MKVLLIEDEPVIAKPTIKVLERENYTVEWACDGEEGLILAQTGEFDIVLLDVMLPKMNGFDVLKKIKQEGITSPVIMLTALGEVNHKLKGLDGGADDYLPKPFDYSELLARMRAVLRRNNTLDENHCLTFADLVFDPFASTLISRVLTATLTSKEANLVELFFSRPKILITKEMIINKLWTMDEYPTDSNVEYHISKLRAKFKKVQSNVSIKVVRGVGYHLEDKS